MDERLIKLHAILHAEPYWPRLYYFKFIIPNDSLKLEQVKSFFSHPDKITYKTSRDIRYIGVSCKEMMPSPEPVIAIYENAYQIDGLIAL